MYKCIQMDAAPKGPEAARWRQRKFAVLRRFPLPQDLLPGSLSLTPSPLRQTHLPLRFWCGPSHLVPDIHGGWKTPGRTDSQSVGG